MKKIFVTLGILVASGIPAIWGYMAYVGRDIAEPDVADLALQRPEIAPEENAYTYFMSAAKSLHRPVGVDPVTGYLNGDPVAPDALTEVLDKNQDMISMIEAGIRYPRCITPEVTGYDTPLPHLTPWRHMAKVLGAKTRHDRMAGRYAEATRACIAHITFADLIQKDAGCLIHYLVGIAILDTGLTQAHGLARDPGTPAPELRRLSESLDAITPVTQGLDRAIRAEYQIAANTVDQLHHGEFSADDLVGSGGTAAIDWGPFSGYYLQPNKTKLIFADIFRDLLANVDHHHDQIDLRSPEEHFDLRSSRLPLRLRPNALGLTLGGLIAPASRMVLESKVRADLRVSATAVLVGIRRYEIDRGSLPDTMEDLIPAYIDSAPIDPYDGQPLRYIADDQIIYSVGKDGEDAGGSATWLTDGRSDVSQRDRRDAKDIVYMVGAQTVQNNAKTTSDSEPPMVRKSSRP